MRSSNAFERTGENCRVGCDLCHLTMRSRRTVAHTGRTVLAMDCVLAGAELQHGRLLNSIVRHHA
jgi:hypothetical protein